MATDSPALVKPSASGQYESELITSPPAIVPSCIHVCILTEDFTKRTLPSANSTLQPPGCWLVALTICELSTPQPDAQSERQEFQGYCVEEGGTIVWNNVSPGVPHAQFSPPFCQAELVYKFACQAALQV